MKEVSLKIYGGSSLTW